MSISIDEKLYDKLKEICDEQHRSVSNYINLLILEKIEDRVKHTGVEVT